MRHLLIIFLLLVLALPRLFGQGLKPDYNTSEEQDSTQNLFGDIESSGIVHKMNSWKLADGYSRIITNTLDTSTINFHIYDPLFKKSYSNSYLGFLGSPYENNLFFDREQNSRFLFLRHLDVYHLSSQNVPYFNTTTPYAHLKYNESKQGSERDLQLFEAFFTRNIDSITNFGFRFDVIKNLSQYNSQEANHKNLLFFISRNSERYNAYFHLINRNNHLLNNGGIVNQTINSLSLPFNLAVNIPGGVFNENKSFAVFTSHEYLMGSIPIFNHNETDSTDIEFTPRYSAQYTAELNHYKRFLNEKSVAQSFFDTTYIKTANHIDSTYFTVFNHAFQLKAFENENRRFTFGKRAFIENELVRAIHPLPYGQRIYTYSNLTIGAEIYNQSGDFWTWRALANFTFLGRNIGDALLKGEITKPIIFNNDTTIVKAEGWYRDISANIFEEHWHSNHFKWENNFKKQHEVVVRASFSYPRFKTNAGFNYALLSNYLYNNQFAMPDQFNGEFSVLSAWFHKDFHIGRFIWSNKATWQAVSNKTALRLPTINAYSSFSYSHVLFKAMKINLGTEVYYHSAYNANFYEPSTTRFYLQDELLTGNYPIINLYANAKLKRTSAFAMLEHANSWFKFGEYFSTPRYPLERMAFRFGFRWTFYD